MKRSLLWAQFWLIFLRYAALYVRALVVDMTLVHRAAKNGAYCLDGSLPAYNLHQGWGNGTDRWLLQFEGGGWCTDIQTCSTRAKTRRGSTKRMSKSLVFSGILSNNVSHNPDFYNWNRVKLRYCDGASFAGDAVLKHESSMIYFRGLRIWHSIIEDLLPKGLKSAKKALLSGCSAGGLASFLHCTSFSSYLPASADVKCLSDAGFFLDGRDVNENYTMRSLFKELIYLQGLNKSFNKKCNSPQNITQCFFPQYISKDIKRPFFILNSAYDVFQYHHMLVPTSADPSGQWSDCKSDISLCNSTQIQILQGLRKTMLQALKPYQNSTGDGMFINSCFAHCQSESQDTWFAADSPRVNHKSISKAVGDWYFNRRAVTKYIDIPYPRDKTCHNLI